MRLTLFAFGLCFVVASFPRCSLGILEDTLVPQAIKKWALRQKSPTSVDNLPTDDAILSRGKKDEDLQNGKPEVQLDYGNFIGKRRGEVESFTGIPYAEPPIGPLRLRNPVPPRRTYPNFNATVFPPGCPQKWPVAGRRVLDKVLTEIVLSQQSSPVIGPLAVGQEDCLTLDIQRPALRNKGSKLPVMVYIFGGAGEFGGSGYYSGENIVSTSIESKTPIIFVAMNYRMNAFGALGGKEVRAEGVTNLGLKDQRLALKWIQRYIGDFGGDPSKVTLAGQSAGAISVSHHIMAYNGNHEGLFRAAICQSGTANPGPNSAVGGQKEFDELVKATGCSGQKDLLQCLRNVDFETFFRGVSLIEGPLGMQEAPFRWIPRIDGDFVTDTLIGSLTKGNFAKVPTITGDLDDEGTFLTLGLLPIMNESRLRNYLSKVFFQNASISETEEVLRLYPSNPASGSPYDTGFSNVLTPVSKRLASLFGDCQFQAPRRAFLELARAHMPVWSYIDKGFKWFPLLGAFHNTDLPFVFGWLPGTRTKDYQSRWIAFVNTMNPNVKGLPDWPGYGDDRQLLLIGAQGSTGTISDTFRSEQMKYLSSHPVSLALQPN